MSIIRKIIKWGSIDISDVILFLGISLVIYLLLNNRGIV